MAHVPVISAGADVMAAVDPPVVAPLAAPAPAQDPGPAPIQAVPEVADAQPVSVLSRCVCIFSLAFCFAFCR